MMRPSSISIWRGSRAASSRSWVITTIVAPCGVQLFEQREIAAPVALSRFPVGSSASTIAGAADQRARDRDALALTAGELVGRTRWRCDEPDPRRALGLRARDARVIATPA